MELSVQLFHYLSLTCCLWVLAAGGIVLNRSNLLVVLICIEVILAAVNLNFILFSVYLDDIGGQVTSLFVLTLAASESAIGLAIVVIYYRLRHSIELKQEGLLKG